MELEKRKLLLVQLGEYMLANEEEWMIAREKAFEQNRWFIPEFISLAVEIIAKNYLQPAALDILIREYDIPPVNTNPKKLHDNETLQCLVSDETTGFGKAQ